MGAEIAPVCGVVLCRCPHLENTNASLHCTARTLPHPKTGKSNGASKVQVQGLSNYLSIPLPYLLYFLKIILCTQTQEKTGLQAFSEVENVPGRSMILPKPMSNLLLLLWAHTCISYYHKRICFALRKQITY